MAYITSTTGQSSPVAAVYSAMPTPANPTAAAAACNATTSPTLMTNGGEFMELKKIAELEEAKLEEHFQKVCAMKFTGCPCMPVISYYHSLPQLTAEAW